MIKIKGLKFKYSGNTTYALDGIDIEIPDGKYIAILGHNGSGKSTLSKLLVGLYKPTEGTIQIDDVVLAKDTLKLIRKKIGIVFQNPDNQFIGASVEDDIAFGLENKKLERREMFPLVEKYASQVGMLAHLDKEPSVLSGGQKQRVAIASTLALDPKIIIFDEVTSMLDPKGKSEVINLIKRIQSEKSKTLISITHDMDEAILADLVLVFSGGKLVASGKPEDILSDKKIVELAKIDAPFIYKVSEALVEKGKKVPITFDEKTLVGALCK